ncbi:MAG: DUF998 domain-containing protein, partial [Promethearchaeota archaeon]
MECYFGLFGALITAICVFTAAFLTSNYDPRINYISDLGYLEFKSLFSIGFVIGGSLGIPFFIYLERELINISESIRRLATGASIITSVCVALVGIIPDNTYLEIFLIFHNLVASVAFIGSCVYISLYSYLMYQGPRTKLYTGPQFKKILAFYGFSINLPLVFFFATWSSLIEWILFILIFLWVILTATTLLEFKFFNLAGVYYRRGK